MKGSYFWYVKLKSKFIMQQRLKVRTVNLVTVMPIQLQSLIKLCAGECFNNFKAWVFGFWLGWLFYSRVSIWGSCIISLPKNWWINILVFFKNIISVNRTVFYVLSHLSIHCVWCLLFEIVCCVWFMPVFLLAFSFILMYIFLSRTFYKRIALGFFCG